MNAAGRGVALRVLAAMDKFKGTATSDELGAVIVRVAGERGVLASAVTLSDGGDGLLDVVGGPNRTTTVTGPQGEPTPARWRLDGATAVVECARASGLVLAGGTRRNDALTATSAGTGELIEAAVTAGARRVLVGLGGSACTDGGLPALAALSDTTVRRMRSGDVELIVCCDVTTRFRDAAVEFAPQKGATPPQLAALTERLDAAQLTLSERYGVDVGELVGGGAAGGLAGGLAAVGGQVRSGFDVVAQWTGLAASLEAADLVITGEGRLDRTSFAGKVVGGVTTLAADVGTEVVAVVGGIAGDLVPGFETISLTERYGPDRAHSDVLECVGRVTGEVIDERVSRRRSG